MAKSIKNVHTFSAAMMMYAKKNKRVEGERRLHVACTAKTDGGQLDISSICLLGGLKLGEVQEKKKNYNKRHLF